MKHGTWDHDQQEVDALLGGFKDLLSAVPMCRNRSLVAAWPRPRGTDTSPAHSSRTPGPSKKRLELETPVGLAEGFSDPHCLLSGALSTQSLLPSLLFPAVRPTATLLHPSQMFGPVPLCHS